MQNLNSSRRLRIRFLTFVILSTGIISFDASADNGPDPLPFKVLGRGLQDRSTGESIQIACVGEIVAGERSCGTMQFLYFRGDGTSALVGPAMRVGEGGVVTRKKVKEILRQYHLAKPIVPGDRVFKMSQALYLGRDTPGADHDLGLLLPAVFLPLGYEFGVATASVAFYGGLAVTGPAAILAGGSIVVLPLLADVILLPFQIRRFHREFGYLFSDLGKTTSLKALQDRAMNAWQLKPRAVPHGRFSRLIEAIEAAPSRPDLENR